MSGSFGGEAGVTWDLESGALNGPISLLVRLRDGAQPPLLVAPWRLARKAGMNPPALPERLLAEAQVEGRFDGRALHLRKLEGDLLGGSVTLEEEAELKLDQWTKSRLALNFEQMMLPRLGVSVPSLRPLAGRASGTLRIAPARDERAPAPLAIELALKPEAVRFGPVPLQPKGLALFAGPGRLVLERFLLGAGASGPDGGQLDLWARLSWPAGEATGQGRLDVSNVGLPWLLRLGSALAGKDAKGSGPEGRVDGRAVVAGTLARWSEMTGRGQFTLSRSDVAALPGISHVYDVLGLRFGAQEPTGEGTVRVRAEAGRLSIGPIRYFNRGVQVGGGVEVARMSEGGASPLEGTLFGVARPLRNAAIPGAETLDELLGAAQGNAALVQVGGTVSEPTFRPRPLAELGRTLNEILGGRSGRAGGG
jgi:hypothetical protein